jgi:hypothetical protein
MQPKMDWGQAKAKVDAMPHPKVTREHLLSRIKEVRYLVDGVMTICVIEMVNGFKVVGKAAPADERNFDRDIGKTFAHDDAFKQLWPLEGYLLRDKLHEEAKANA